MIKNYDPLLFRLINIFERLKGGKTLRKKYLAKEFNVGEKTIQNDINKRLANVLDINVSRNGYSLRNYDNIEKENFEDKLILNILESISSSLGDEFCIKSQKIFDKLKNPHEDFILSKMQIEDISKNKDNIQLLKNAINDRKIVKFEYHDKKREIESYKITIFEGFWYLYARDVFADKFKTFYIKEIESLKKTDRNFKINEKMMQILDDALNIWFEPDKEPFEVILFAKNDIVKYFERRKISPTQRIIRKTKEGMEFSICTTSKRAVMHEVKKWIPDLLVVSPQSLAEDMISIVKKFENYQMF